MALAGLKKFIKRHSPEPLLKMLQAHQDRERGYSLFVTNEGGTSGGLEEGMSGNELLPYFRLLLNFDHRNAAALDRAHNLQLIGTVLAQKPDAVVELGVGTGYLSMSLAHALRYNTKGTLTCVDNWLMTGHEPPLAEELRRLGVNVVTSGEEKFVRGAPTDAYDLLISDADHEHSHQWLDQHVRMVRNNGMLFFHDTNQPSAYPALNELESRLKAMGLATYHFKQNSRPDEHCDRGWLFAINHK